MTYGVPAYPVLRFGSLDPTLNLSSRSGPCWACFSTRAKLSLLAQQRGTNYKHNIDLFNHNQDTINAHMQDSCRGALGEESEDNPTSILIWMEADRDGSWLTGPDPTETQNGLVKTDPEEGRLGQNQWTKSYNSWTRRLTKPKVDRSRLIQTKFELAQSGVKVDKPWHHSQGRWAQGRGQAGTTTTRTKIEDEKNPPHLFLTLQQLRTN